MSKNEITLKKQGLAIYMQMHVQSGFHLKKAQESELGALNM